MDMYTTCSSRLGTMPALLPHVDASTQADLVGYESEDERMGRRLGSRLSGSKHRQGTPYSKIDIREQYCINSKEIQVLESGKPTSALFGCLSKHSESSCHSRHSLLSVCVDRVPSDENLHESSRQPLPRRPVDELERAYLHRRPKSSGDPGRYAWIPEDEEPNRMELARSVRPDDKDSYTRPMSFSSEHLATNCPAHYLPPPPPPPAGSSRTKHVSFARSHTLTSFDDAIMELRRGPNPYRSQERLILSVTQPRRTGILPFAAQEKKVTKKLPMKTQATQTGLTGREPPNYLSLSPRTIHRVTTVSQAAQTNGQLLNGRRLMKSYSEAGYNFGFETPEERHREHEALMRTQSEEPRSPYSQPHHLPWPVLQSDSDLEPPRSRKVYKEIFIDFEPADVAKQFWPGYTYSSDGDFMSDLSLNNQLMEPVFDRVDGVKVSLSSYSTEEETGIEKSQIKMPQDSLDEEFHENLVYREIFKKDQSMPLCKPADSVDYISPSCSPEKRDQFPNTPITSTLNVAYRVSPFASNDSLTTDHRADHSDGIWNESQLTVLHAESDNGNGLTPSKKHKLLLQHQQRSSMDTEALEEDFLQHQQSPLFSPQKESAVPSVTVATVHRSFESKSPVYGPNATSPRQGKCSLSPGSTEVRRKLSKSLEKEDDGHVKDISETSTTEDYATAHDNSGTDTSFHQRQNSKPGSKDGSSFESASSLPSINKEESQMQVVPTSPPAIIEEIIAETAEKDERGLEEREETYSFESSSSGSYSITSCQRDKEWTEHERSCVKKSFTLDLSPDKADNSRHDLKSPTDKAKSGNMRKIYKNKIKKWTVKEDSIAPGMVRSPAMPEGFKSEEWAPPYRSTPHTPEEATIFHNKNEAELSSDESSFEYKNTGIEERNGHSPRRRKRGYGRNRRGHGMESSELRRRGQNQLSPPKNCHSPAPSPRSSPSRKQQKGTKLAEQDGMHLKAASAESLRSVSPGSDSVFYNEGETHILCHECGRGVGPREVSTVDIVQPPARFADSPEGIRANKTNRLFKKQEKRFRSEERDRGDRRRQKARTDNLRAKSEERDKEKPSKSILRPHAHSTDASMEFLRGAESSPSFSDQLVNDEPRIYMESFQNGSWIIVDEDYQLKEERYDITEEEKEFVRRYMNAFHRIVHKKSCLEMFRRLEEKTFRSDKKVVIHRGTTEFGFRIHGSKPVVVSGIEPDTPAEASGLEVGDIVLSINGTSVMDATHTDVVTFAHSGLETIEMEVSRCINVITAKGLQIQTKHSGILYMIGPDGEWHQRLFELKDDNCLYSYKSKEGRPVGALLLLDYSITPLEDVERTYCFALEKPGARSLELSADTAEEMNTWKDLIEAAAAAGTCYQARWLDRVRTYLTMPAASIPEPDCFGHLTQLEDKWRRRYCILKDSALLLFADSSAEKALGIACLQGYRVQLSGPISKRFSFEVVPPESKQKHFYFYADSDMDRKRWITALEYSTDRWLQIS